MFRKAYVVEAERLALLRRQAGGANPSAGVAAEVTPPVGSAGAGRWRAALAAARAEARHLEDQLRQASGAADVRAVALPDDRFPTAAAAEARAAPIRDPSGARAQGNAGTRRADEGRDGDAGLIGFDEAGGEPSAEVSDALERVAVELVEDEAALRLLAVPVLGEGRPVRPVAALPPLPAVRDALEGEAFAVAEVVEFPRVYVVSGALAGGTSAADLLAGIKRRLGARGLGKGIELFAQRSKRAGQCLVIVLWEDDLPLIDVAWWQWLLCAALLFGTLLSSNFTALGLSGLAAPLAPASGPSVALVTGAGQVLQTAAQNVPTAAAILATLAAQEAARRAVAARYRVDLTPPFFVPAVPWPMPSVGCFGAITRRVSLAPNDEAVLAMSVAAGLAGYVVAILILSCGLAIGPDPSRGVDLNFQLLPLALKALLRPFLGRSSLADASDPFGDPVSVAFPSNPLAIGGVAGLVVVSLNLLPFGRLDGGVITRIVAGGRLAALVGPPALLLLAAAALPPAGAAPLCVAFAGYAAALQSGAEPPPRDAVTEPGPALRALGGLLVLGGTLLSLPGALPTLPGALPPLTSWPLSPPLA